MPKQKKLKPFTISKEEIEIMDLAAYQINYLTDLLKDAPIIFPDNSGMLFETDIQVMISDWYTLTAQLLED